MKNESMEQKRQELRDTIKGYETQKMEVRALLMASYVAEFDADEALQACIKEVESCEGGSYEFGEDGEVEYHLAFKFPENKEEHDALVEYLNERGIYTSKYALVVCLGYDNIMIQEKHGRDNGVYQNGCLIIERGEYETHEERNALIEKHMEKMGVFPGVFEVWYSGKLIPVTTLSK